MKKQTTLANGLLHDMVVLNIFSAVINMYNLDKKMEERCLITVDKWSHHMYK